MLWRDPDRWVDADMQRIGWLRLGLALCAASTVIVIIAGTVIVQVLR